jgi:hemolysin type calcium-binding protein/Big-like domain-containing protein
LSVRLTFIVVASLAFAASAFAWSNAARAHHSLNYEVRHQTIRGQGVTVATHGDPFSAFKDPTTLPPSAETQSGVPASIAPSWCGTPRTTDDTINESGSQADPKIRVIYAYPSDAPNNFSTYANMIQSDLKADFDAVAAASNSTKSLRFDLGTDCGPEFLDITTVNLPRPASYYDDFYKIRNDLAAALGSSANKRSYLAYTDRIAPHGYGGQGQIIPDDSPGSGNESNIGGLYAFVYYGSWWNYTNYYRRLVPLHEIGHNLGAVQQSAPHSSQLWHCFDEYDLMCYNDGGSYFANGGSLTYTCPRVGEDEPWDCNADDYFSPDPPNGSYLSTHWNLYNSVFLCALASCTPDGGIPPDTAITSGPSDQTNDPTPTFSFSSTEAGSTFECHFDFDPFAPCSGPDQSHTPATPLTDGPHTFEVLATDPAGNTDPTPASWSFTVDTAPPDTEVDGPSGPTNDPTPTFTISSSETGSRFRCRVDSGSYAACSSPKTTSHLTDGSHTFYVRATDPAGNLDPTPASHTFTVRTASVRVSDTTLVVTAAAGAKDNLAITRRSASVMRVTDLPSGAYTGSGVHTSAGCTRSGDHTAECSGEIARIQVSSADRPDQVVNSTGVESSLIGGSASDILIGGFGKDTVNGGAGADVMKGMRGNDQLLARDLTSDTTINCDGGIGTPGSADKADLDLLPKDPNSAVTNCETKTRH